MYKVQEKNKPKPVKDRYMYCKIVQESKRMANSKCSPVATSLGEGDAAGKGNV